MKTETHTAAAAAAQAPRSQRDQEKDGASDRGGPPMSKAGYRMVRDGEWDGIPKYKCPKTGETALDNKVAAERHAKELKAAEDQLSA